jgi:GH18 family chitinase
MGFSTDYPDVPEWVSKPEGYQADAMVKYEGNIFKAKFWAGLAPGELDSNGESGWELYDELYDLTSGAPTTEAKIIGYLPTWRKEDGFNYADPNLYQYITHGIIAFLMFDEANLGQFSQEALEDVNLVIRDVVRVGQSMNTKILIALGGATDYGFRYLMEQIGNNPSDPILDQTVKRVVDFVNKNGLDGVDLDLECWWPDEQHPGPDIGGRLEADGPAAAGLGLTKFAQALKQAMPGKIISAAVFGTSYYGNNYDPAMVQYLDWIGIMSYDFTGSWNESPVGPHTALYKIRNQEQYMEEQQMADWDSVDNPINSVEESLWYWTNPFYTNWQGKGQEFPRNKMAAGVPIYGYDFPYEKDPDDLSGEIPPGYKFVGYNEIIAEFPDADQQPYANIKVSGLVPRPDFVPNPKPGDYQYEHNLYYETPVSAVEKLEFLKLLGATGVIIWELSLEFWENNKSVVQALYQSSGNATKARKCGRSYSKTHYGRMRYRPKKK